MRENKLVKAYTAAWRWPEVYTTSAAVIWTSRAIAVAVPLSLVALTIITGVPLFGLGATGLMSAFLVFIIIMMTIQIFYQEYDTVEDFQARENRIKEFFHGFPSITAVPLTELEQGEWVAYGHVAPDEFLDAIQTVVYSVTEDPLELVPYMHLENSVGHLYASFNNPREAYWSDGLTLCKATAENAIPITRLSL